GELVDTDSGSANCCGAAESPAGDVRDTHLYSGPFAVPADSRASVIGEYGAVLPYPPASHRWPGVLTSIGSPVLAWPAPPAIDLLRAQFADLEQEMRERGLSGAVFTELASYEQELGVLTYDRRVYTMDPAVIRGLNDALITASRRDGLWPQPPAVPAGESGQWSFSEGTGTTAADASGHANTLSLEGGAGWTAGPRLGGRPSGALEITGSGQSATAASTVIDTRRSFTVSVWLDPAVAQESGSAVSEAGPDGSSFSLGIQSLPAGSSPPRGPASWWTFVVPASSNCTAAQCGVRANMRYDDGRFSPPPGAWDQLTAVYDTATQTISLYVDGVPEDAEHVFGIPTATGPLTVGGGSDDYEPSDFFEGAIAALRTYPRALTPAEVWQLYRSQVVNQ
ncbi:MAG TPA: LamG domain-containing protein, partial [Candidatus Limnocylindria bacterium]|nr:LamG domain-containing protein [Candidatus Limnocylindria bacterium]